MTHITALELFNYGPFAGGGHVLSDIKPGVHAVVARFEHDDERSNWGGKSTFLSAIPYVLFGWHLHRTEDEAITNGADSVAVELEFSDGSVARRERKRGKSTQLKFTPAGAGECGGPEAERALAALVGLVDDDFFSTCYFRQKGASLLVTDRPADRMKRFGAWFELDLGERCIENAGERQGKAQEQVDQLEAKLAAQREQVDDIGRAYPGEGELGARLDAALESASTQWEGTRLALATAREHEKVAALREEFAKANADGKALRKQVDAIPLQPIVDLEQAHRVEREAFTLAKHQLAEAKRLAVDGFDGSCPVIRAECPARKQVDARLKLYGSAAQELEAAVHEQALKVTAALEPLQAAQKVIAERERGVIKLEALRERARELKARLDTAPKPAKLDADWLAKAEQEQGKRVAAIAAHRDQHKRATERVAQLELELAAARLEARAAALGGEVLRKAQRAVARQRAGEVEVGANELFRSSGIDLGVELKWEQEGGGLAGACTSCGLGFPRGNKVKKCQSCGAARGSKVIDKPVFELTHVSGAAEDTAGIALQLSAARYLRRRRGTAWSVACIDEPFGALDATNRRALAAHLVAMLRGSFGFEQSFITAHQQDVLDAIPGRVEIIAGPRGSRLA